MACKFAVLFALIAVANAGYLTAPTYTHTVATPPVVSLQSNILRFHGNALGQLSTYSKAIDSPYSAAYKSDLRVSNNGLVYPYAHRYEAPAYSLAYAAPVHSATYAVPAVRHQYPTPSGLLGIAYSPATTAARFSYSNGYGVHYSY